MMVDNAPMRLSWSRLYQQFGVNPAKGGDRVTVDNFRKDCLRELIKRASNCTPSIHL